MISNRDHKLRNLILGEKPLSDEETAQLLAPLQFDDWRSACQCLQRLAHLPGVGEPLAKLAPTLLQALTDAASPDRALINLEHFVNNFDDRSALFRSLTAEPRLLEMLIILFTGSQFLTEILLRYPDYFEQIKVRKRLAQLKSREQLHTEATDEVASCNTVAQKCDALRRFQRWELLRIGASDLFGFLDLQAVTAQLSNLARSLVKASLTVVAYELNMPADALTVLALGKLGGRELNYSSDIDLLFLAKTKDEKVQRLGQRLIRALTRATSEGFLYRVDMRLRPWGRLGTLAPTLDENLAYLREHAQLWEKQAMYKARVIAGDDVLGIQFLQHTKPLLLNLPLEALRIEIHKMRKKTEAQLRRSGKAWGEVKTGVGSIRDVEFVTQYLQLTQGSEHPEVHSRNTLDALARLTACGVLPRPDYRIMNDGYIFLRSVEHHLQIMQNRQTHLLPKDPHELNYVARRLGFRDLNAGAKLSERYLQHSLAIREVYRQYVEKDKTEKLPPTRPPVSAALQASSSHLAQMDTGYALVFEEKEIQRHAEMAVCLNRDTPVAVEAVPLENKDWQVTIVGYDYFGELSLICGLLFVYGMNIIQGAIFTYEPVANTVSEKVASLKHRRRFSRLRAKKNSKRKIVDVFTVRSVQETVSAEHWQRFSKELTRMIKKLPERKQREVQGELAKRVSKALQEFSAPAETLMPVDIAVDNTASENYTVLRIDAPDTIGFLYEFTNALALNGIYISRVMISSLGNRVHDTLFVTDVHGKKITDPLQQRQLRAATVLVKHFTHLLPHSPNPESALLHFREFVSQLFTQPEWPKELVSIERPEVLDALAKLLGVSDFLWNDFLRMQHANLFPVVRDVKALNFPKSRDELKMELAAVLGTGRSWSTKKRHLNEFKDREMFRIDMRYILNLVQEFKHFAAELSDLAEVVVEAAFLFSFAELQAQFGQPQLESGAPCRFCLCALGKFGGREIGFASDIELMFLYGGKGETSETKSISNSEFFELLINKVNKAIRAKQEGIFEIDLRLRPYGKAGALAVLLDSFRTYYSPDGPAWDYERQALVKMRPILGDSEFCQQAMAARDACLYTGQPLDVAAMRAMRERQIRELVAGGAVNAKYSPGALVDLEYLVQGLQIKHGKDNPELRSPRTSEAMAALTKHGILSTEDFNRLQAAHLYLRRLIEALRMVRGHSKDLTVPEPDSSECAFLARRLGYSSDSSGLGADLIRHTSFVQELSSMLLA
ncbi:MAG: glutamine synthetase adenylyltransferase [bacterium]